MKDPLINNISFMIIQRKFGTEKRNIFLHNKDIFQSSNPIALNKQIVALGHKQIWKDILMIYHKHKREMEVSNIATIYNQLSKIKFLDKQDPDFLQFVNETISQIQSKTVKEIGSRYFATILHSSVKLGPSTKSSSLKLIAQLNCKENVLYLFESKNVQRVSNCIWACAKLGIQSPYLFSLLESRADWLFENGTCQEVSNCIWACAKLCIQSPNLFQLLDSRADWLLENGDVQGISNCIWACATLGIHPPTLFSLLESRADWLFENGSVQGISNCVWACAKLGIQSPNLFCNLEAQVDWLFENGDVQDISNCVWAISEHGVLPRKFIDLVNCKAEWLLSHDNFAAVAMIAGALAKHNVKSSNLYTLLKEKIA